jgi:hypothetical protein
MKKTILMLAFALSASAAFAEGSRSGGTQFVNSHPLLDSVYVSVKGNELNALSIRKSSTATRVSVEAKVWWNNDLAKVGGFGHANSMSVIETKDMNKFKIPGLPFDYRNAFEVVSGPKPENAHCTMFSPSASSAKVQGVCTEIIITIPAWASAEQDYNTTQVLDAQGNEVGVYVYNLRQPLPPPPPVVPPTPGPGFISISPNELYQVQSMMSNAWDPDQTKAQKLEQFIQRKCQGF